MKIALLGYGRMGKAVEVAAEARGHRIVFRGRDMEETRSGASASPPLGGADVAIEFTRGESAPEAILMAAGRGLPVISGTTGWGDRLEEVSARVRAGDGALLHAPNLSLGVHLFVRIVREAARLVERLPEYDPSLLEIHHRYKADHPSGTALRLADVLLREISRKDGWSEDPSAIPPEPGLGAERPTPLSVGVIRAGENPGTHVVALEGPVDRIELRHEAKGRKGFARGAVEAAEWIRGRRGVFTMDDFVADRFGGGSRSEEG